MSLFGKKKEEIHSNDLKLDLPNFPEYPSNNIGNKYPGIENKQIPTLSPLEKQSPLSHAAPGGNGVKMNVPDLNPIREDEGGRSLFVKIDKYEDAVRTVDKIKEDLRKTDEILGRLEAIKSKEDAELDAWHNDIKKVKDRLLHIDRVLFETK